MLLSTKKWCILIESNKLAITRTEQQQQKPPCHVEDLCVYKRRTPVDEHGRSCETAKLHRKTVRTIKSKLILSLAANLPY